MKRVLCIMFLVLLLGLTATTVGANTWKMFGYRPHGDDGWYRLTWTTVDYAKPVQVYVSPDDLDVLLKWWDVKFPGQLLGKLMKSDQPTPELAIELILLKAKHGGEYAIPTKDEIYGMATRAIAEQRSPDFSRVFSGAVKTVFGQAFDGKGKINRKWMQAFNQRIVKASNGRAKIAKHWAYGTKKNPMAAVEVDYGDKRVLYLIYNGTLDLDSNVIQECG